MPRADLSPSSVPLAELTAGGKATVKGLSGGRDFADRVASLGFVPGAEVTMLRNLSRGPILVLVRGTRIALGRGEAVKIFVERELGREKQDGRARGASHDRTG